MTTDRLAGVDRLACPGCGATWDACQEWTSLGPRGLGEAKMPFICCARCRHDVRPYAQPAPDARAAAQAVVDKYAHFEDCYPVGPCTCGLDRLRAALDSQA